MDRLFPDPPDVVFISSFTHAALSAYALSHYLKALRREMIHDPGMRAFFEQKTTQIPRFFGDLIKKDLGPLWDWLPDGALYYDHKAYLHAQVQV